MQDYTCRKCGLLHVNGFCRFFFNDTATTEIYTLSLHDALPIWPARREGQPGGVRVEPDPAQPATGQHRGQRVPTLVDRKSTRLNSSHANISYAVFCLKKKKNLCSKTYKLRILMTYVLQRTCTVT